MFFTFEQKYYFNMRRFKVAHFLFEMEVWKNVRRK